MRIAVGADHGGYKLKQRLIKYLEARGYLVADLGTHSLERCDYPLVGQKVARAKGIVLEGTTGSETVVEEGPDVIHSPAKDLH